MGRIAGAGRSQGAHRFRRGEDQRIPRRARADRLRIQGFRPGTRRLPRPAGRARSPVVLEVRRGSHHPLARAGGGIRRPATAAGGPEPHMKGLCLFLHVLGVVGWLGGWLAIMISGIAAKYFPPEQRLAVYHIMSVVSRNLIGPGAVLVVFSGFVLSVPYFKSATAPSWLL